MTLKRTEEILRKKFDSVKDHLPQNDKSGRKGDDEKNLRKNAEELMSKKEIASKISQKKADLAPIL